MIEETNLINSIRQIDSGVDIVDHYKKELERIEEVLFLSSFHTAKVAIEKAHKDNKKEGLVCRITYVDGRIGNYLLAEVFNEKDSGKKSLNNKEIDSIFESIYAKVQDVWYKNYTAFGDIIRKDSILIHFDNPILPDLADIILSQENKVTYKKAVLELQLNSKGTNTKKHKI